MYIAPLIKLTIMGLGTRLIVYIKYEYEIIHFNLKCKKLEQNVL